MQHRQSQTEEFTDACTLSICVTTRNRARLLDSMLASLWAQLPAAGVECVVTDAGSEDGTLAVIEHHRSDGRPIRYELVSPTCGIDEGYDAAAALARGKYIWFMSDDDLYTDDAVEELLSALQGEPALVVVDRECWDREFHTLLKARDLDGNVRTYLPGEEPTALEDLANHLQFIPSVVIRRSWWMSSDRHSYYGSFFCHVGVIFQNGFPGPVIRLARPLIRMRSGNISYGARFLDIWSRKWPEIIWSFEHLPAASRRKVVKERTLSCLGFALFLRALGALNIRSWWQQRQAAPARTPWRAAFVAVLPHWHAVCVIYLKARLTDPNHAFVLYMLESNPSRPEGGAIFDFLRRFSRP